MTLFYGFLEWTESLGRGSANAKKEKITRSKFVEFRSNPLKIVKKLDEQVKITS